MSHAFLALIERDGYRWLRHAAGLDDRPIDPSDDVHLVRLGRAGQIGHSSVRRGECSFFLRLLEADASPCAAACGAAWCSPWHSILPRPRPGNGRDR
jgi:hypothetical protein